MRAIRKYLMRERRLPATAYDVMGYWRAAAGSGSRAPSTPGPIWRRRQGGGQDRRGDLGRLRRGPEAA